MDFGMRNHGERSPTQFRLTLGAMKSRVNRCGHGGEVGGNMKKRDEWADSRTL